MKLDPKEAVVLGLIAFQGRTKTCLGVTIRSAGPGREEPNNQTSGTLSPPSNYTCGWVLSIAFLLPPFRKGCYGSLVSLLCDN